ncbi:MAG: hypothetical protein Q9167_000991 [Letrouitia subvulpina]
MPNPRSSGPKGKGWDDQSTYVGSERSGGSATTYNARHPLVPSVTERPLSGAETRFIPLAKPFDGSVSPGPPYPRVLAFSSPTMPHPSQGSRGSYEHAYSQGQQHRTAEHEQQNRVTSVDGNSYTRRANRSGYPQYGRSTSVALHRYRRSINSSPTYQPIRRPWDPRQTPEPAPTTPQPSWDRNVTFRSSARLQDWEREPAFRGPYHGIASVPHKGS